MNKSFVVGIILVLHIHHSRAQEVTLDDLIYFQTTKNSLKIDSVLLTKEKWDCNCFGDDDHQYQVKNWIYNIADTTRENIDKDYIRLDQIGQGYSSTITYYTKDREKADLILNEMISRDLVEEKVMTLKNDSINAKSSFFLINEVAVQTMIGEYKMNENGKYMFIFMDKNDNLKGLVIK